MKNSSLTALRTVVMVLRRQGRSAPSIFAAPTLFPVHVKPLSPLETRCYAALQAFQEQHDRLPNLHDLTDAANFSGGGQTGDVLHRLS